MPDLRQRVSEELLPFVRGPAQYIGGEVNSMPRDWDGAEVRIALAFPDTYAMGIGQLGCQILYWIANRIDGVACERVYAPWTDAEQVMRDRSIPLFTWESRRPVASADILAFSLQYEMHFSNVLNLLDLAGIPLRSADRLAATPQAPAYPLVIAGGPQADNPEPLADFIDLFVIGDGEHAIEAIIEECRKFKRFLSPSPSQGEGGERVGPQEYGPPHPHPGPLPERERGKSEFLLTMARKYPWAYVPSRYDVSYNRDGTIAAVTPRVAGLPEKIVRCRTDDFETVAFPTAQIIPWVQAVHERATVEIMRGCPQNCRFCHAGRTKRPLRWRSVERICELAEAAWRDTGFSELALTSLSTSDYPRLGELMERLNAAFGPRRVSLAVPSLRVDQQLKHLPWQLRQVRKSGLTIAVEAAREPMRRVICKKVADVDLLDGVRAAYAAGWRSVKLYFMVGFPGETEDDVRGIVELARQVAMERKKLAAGAGGRGLGPASVTASVAPFVPKPHTPFQWAAQRDADYFRRARALLKDLARGTPVQVKFHHIDRSALEAVFSRGDRRQGAVIEAAWRAGARFDAWDECFNPDLWRAAFAGVGLDPAFYAHRDRPFDEVLPWDHIQSGPPCARLRREAEAARALLATLEA